MSRQRYINIGVGLFMLLSFIAFLLLFTKVSGISNIVSHKGYYISAKFTDVGGLKVRAPVTIAGVKVGEVSDIALQPKDFNAKVTMRINQNNKIPFEETSARILTEGLIGSNYISIVPGFDDNKNHPYLIQGDVIDKTQEAVILENLIGQLLFNVKKQGDS